MAENKKSFVAYSDWKETFDKLPDEIAGKLIKHIFAYVNDENPISNDYVIDAVFANIKHTLKRDLLKWEKQLLQRRDAGLKSAEQRALTKINERSTPVENIERNHYYDYKFISIRDTNGYGWSINTDNCKVFTKHPDRKSRIESLEL